MSDFSSQLSPFRYGVPQGSGFGPLLFILYTFGKLEGIIRSDGVSSFYYADGCQLFFFCRPGEQDSHKAAVVSCISIVANWMPSTGLKLNPTKKEFL